MMRVEPRTIDQIESEIIEYVLAVHNYKGGKND